MPLPRHPLASSFLFTLALLLIPASIYLEKFLPNTWDSPLFHPAYLNESSFHTPTHTDGTYLPPLIDQDTVLTPDQNPVLLPRTTTVTSNATLTIQAGTEIYTNEFSSLIIAGTLNITGQENQSVLFTTNETHSDNQTWNGIILLPSSKSYIDFTHITHGVPALTCESGSSAFIDHSSLSSPVLSVFSSSSNCYITNSRLISARDGMHIINSHPTLTNITYSIAKKAVVEY